MKTIAYKPVCRATAVLATGLLLGGIFAATAQSLSLPAQTNQFRMASNYLAGTSAPYNAGGGVPAQPLITSQNITATNATLNWYGMQGWYAILSSPDLVNWTQVGNGFACSSFNSSATFTNTIGPSGHFILAITNSFAGQGSCGSCHGNKYTAWTGTAHSRAIKEIMNPDGTFSGHASQSCLPCHTVGYNQPTGYKYTTNSASYSSPLANVGCENCHGPSGWHKDSDHALILPAVSADPTICGSCHTGHNPQFNEYTNVISTVLTNLPMGLFVGGVGHSVGSHGGSGNSGCARCHEANQQMVMVNEYYDNLAGSPHPLNFFPSTFGGAMGSVGAASCVSCHDPHSSNYVAQLRYPTYSTNFYVIPALFYSATAVVTNYGGTITTNTLNMNYAFDATFNPKVQVCGQCHSGGGGIGVTGMRWDGKTYGFVTNLVASGPVTNTVYVNITTNVTFTQVFTNELGVPYLTNTYNYTYVVGRYATNVVSTSTNPVVGVGTFYALVAYTNIVPGVSTNIAWSTNSSGFNAPHYPVQYNVLVGQLADDYESVAGVSNVLTDPHTLAPNQCVDCHVPARYAIGSTNITGHTFVSDNNGCLASCHSPLTSAQLATKTLNSKVAVSNSIVRVVSLLKQWGMTVAPDILRTNYGTCAWEYPSPLAYFGAKSTNIIVGVSTNKYLVGPPRAYSPSFGAVPTGTNDNVQLAYVPQDIWKARFSLYAIYYDQSLGVHNPTYVKSLLADAENRVMNQFINANYPAAFGASPVSGTAGATGLTVNFTNYVSGSAYSWTFGDGGNGSSSNPTHTYTAPGLYSVTCIVDGNQLIRTNYISVH